MVEGQFREQTGWQCCVPAVLPCPWNHPLPWQCPGQERLITQSCCPWSRAPRLRAHLCLPMARGDTPGDAMSPSSSLGPFCTCGSQMQRRTYPLTCKARLNKQEHDGDSESRTPPDEVSREVHTQEERWGLLWGVPSPPTHADRSLIGL